MVISGNKEATRRSEKAGLCVLIDRRFSKQLPIQPDERGRPIDAIVFQKVKVL